jgi:hypothetical protein
LTKDLVHCWQLNILVLSTGISLIWIYWWWEASPSFCEKDLPHNVQLYGFSPVCTLICVSSQLLLPKVLLNCWQLNNLVFLTAGTFCSTAFSALALSPSCSFLKTQKKKHF